MCNCIKETEERIKNNLSSKNERYKGKTITNVEIQNTAIMDDSNQQRLFAPVKIEYEVLNKNNVLVSKKGTVDFTYSYCPFCGEKYE